MSEFEFRLSLDDPRTPEVLRAIAEALAPPKADPEDPDVKAAMARWPEHFPPDAPVSPDALPRNGTDATATPPDPGADAQEGAGEAQEGDSATEVVWNDDAAATGTDARPGTSAADDVNSTVRLTEQMEELVRVLYEASPDHSADRSDLSRALPRRSNNSIGRSLGAMERGGVARPRFAGSGHWTLTPRGVAAAEGRVKVKP